LPSGLVDNRIVKSTFTILSLADTLSMEDDYILEALHHRIDNAKRDLLKQGKSTEESLQDIKFAIFGMYDQFDEIRKALNKLILVSNGFGNTLQGLAEIIEEKFPDANTRELE
jgi:hypothetical protein